MSRAKQKSLSLILIAGVLTLFLAMSLPDLSLSPGQPFSLERPTPEAPGVDAPLPDSDLLMRIFQGFLALALIALPFYIFFSLLTPKGRRRLIAEVVLIVVLLLIADYVHNLPRGESVEPENQAIGVPPNWDQLAESGPTTLFPANPPQGLILAVILAVSILVVAMTGAILWFFWKRKRSPEFTFEKLAEEAQNAIESIHAGGDLEMTIMRCYQEMSRVLREEKGITRERSMTPREFESRLISRGLPQAPIRTLTRLFEQVRYSRIPTGAPEQDLALSCLTDIVAACRGTGNGYEQP